MRVFGQRVRGLVRGRRASTSVFWSVFCRKDVVAGGPEQQDIATRRRQWTTARYQVVWTIGCRVARVEGIWRYGVADSP